VVDFVDDGIFIERIERQIKTFQPGLYFLSQFSFILIFNVIGSVKYFALSQVKGRLLLLFTGDKKQEKNKKPFPPDFQGEGQRTDIVIEAIYSHSMVEGGLELTS
jgi:hypothetical protein